MQRSLVEVLESGPKTYNLSLLEPREALTEITAHLMSQPDEVTVQEAHSAGDIRVTLLNGKDLSAVLGEMVCICAWYPSQQSPEVGTLR